MIKGIRHDLRDNLEIFDNNAENNDINRNWVIFKSMLLKSIDNHIPNKVTNGKPDLPWLTNHIKRLIRKKQRQRRFNTAKKYNSERDWDRYQEIRKKYTQS